MASLALGKTRSRREPNMGCRGADRPGWCDVVTKKSLHERWRMVRRIDADSLICSLGHCECDGHRVHKLSQRRLTADLLAPRESDSSRTRCKVSSDWLPSYIKATQPVLEIFKMAGYFPDRPCTMNTAVFLPGVKRPGRHDDNSLPSNPEIKNEWSYTSTPLYAFMA
jgi:hypothetical protein